MVLSVIACLLSQSTVYDPSPNRKHGCLCSAFPAPEIVVHCLCFTIGQATHTHTHTHIVNDTDPCSQWIGLLHTLHSLILVTINHPHWVSYPHEIPTFFCLSIESTHLLLCLFFNKTPSCCHNSYIESCWMYEWVKCQWNVFLRFVQCIVWPMPGVHYMTFKILTSLSLSH